MRSNRWLGGRISAVTSVIALGGGALVGCDGELGELVGQGGGTGATGVVVTSAATGFGEAATNGSGGSTGAGCAAVSQEAMPVVRPVDIIIAVDTSGSMTEEMVWVQDHMNDLSDIVTQSGVDAHVVLISDSNICVPAPLGSGQCGGGADTKLPGFFHLDTFVSSNDALERYVTLYPDWSPHLRSDAIKIFVAITDDNSFVDASTFTAQVLALDPSFQGFKFDGIFSFDPPGVCSYSAAEGTVYEELVAQTMGVSGDLCLQDFGPVFQDIATNIVASSAIACNFDIPPPPNGEAFDLGKVNVQYSLGGQSPTTVLYIAGGEAACTDAGGWYYDDLDDPTEIVLCPETCDAVNGIEETKVDVLFGCASAIPS